MNELNIQFPLSFNSCEKITYEDDVYFLKKAFIYIAGIFMGATPTRKQTSQGVVVFRKDEIFVQHLIADTLDGAHTLDDGHLYTPQDAEGLIATTTNEDKVTLSLKLKDKKPITLGTFDMSHAQKLAKFLKSELNLETIGITL